MRGKTVPQSVVYGLKEHCLQIDL